MTIEYYVKNVYGKDLIYPADEKIATAIQCLSGYKTLTNSGMTGLKLLGFELKEILRPHPELKVLPQERTV